MYAVDFKKVREAYWRAHHDQMFDGDTRQPEVAYQTDAGLLFITAEHVSDEIRYSVRRLDALGDIQTVGLPKAYEKRSDALRAIAEMHIKGTI